MHHPQRAERPSAPQHFLQTLPCRWSDRLALPTATCCVAEAGRGLKQVMMNPFQFCIFFRSLLVVYRYSSIDLRSFSFLNDSTFSV